LYKLLYGEIDEDLVHMTDEEWLIILVQPVTYRLGVGSRESRTEPKYRVTEVTNTLSLGPNAQILFDDGSSLLGMFGSGLVSDPKTTLETFNNLSVTPAALLAVERAQRRVQKRVGDYFEASGDVAVIRMWVRLL
jgi:hypothetical protein